MSIINEALKKTQNHLDKGKDKKNTTPSPKDDSPPDCPNHPSKALGDPADRNRRNNKKWYSNIVVPIYLLTTLSAVTVAVVVYWMDQPMANKVLFTPSTEVAPPGPVPTATVPPPMETAPAGQPLVAETDLVTAVDQPLLGKTLKLTGIMMRGDKRVALINDDIYELGDFVEGKQIIDITLKTVVLSDNQGNTLTLDVRDKK